MSHQEKPNVWTLNITSSNTQQWEFWTTLTTTAFCLKQYILCMQQEKVSATEIWEIKQDMIIRVGHMPGNIVPSWSVYYTSLLAKWIYMKFWL